MNACRTDELLLLAAGELAPDRTAELKRHLAACPACADELRRLREDLARLDALTPMEPSALAVERAIRAGRQAVAQRRPRRLSFVYRYRRTLAVAAALVALFGWTLVSHRSEPGLTNQQLDSLWEQSLTDVTDSNAMVEELTAQFEANPWTEAQQAVVGRLAEPQVDDELLEIEESLDHLEGMSWDS